MKKHYFNETPRYSMPYKSFYTFIGHYPSFLELVRSGIYDEIEYRSGPSLKETINFFSEYNVLRDLNEDEVTNIIMEGGRRLDFSHELFYYTKSREPYDPKTQYIYYEIIPPRLLSRELLSISDFTIIDSTEMRYSNVMAYFSGLIRNFDFKNPVRSIAFNRGVNDYQDAKFVYVYHENDRNLNASSMYQKIKGY